MAISWARMAPLSRSLTPANSTRKSGRLACMSSAIAMATRAATPVASVSSGLSGTLANRPLKVWGSATTVFGAGIVVARAFSMGLSAEGQPGRGPAISVARDCS